MSYKKSYLDLLAKYHQKCNEVDDLSEVMKELVRFEWKEPSSLHDNQNVSSSQKIVYKLEEKE